MPRINILLADDHALVRSAFRSMLSAEPDLNVVGEAEDGVVVVDLCRRLQPDVVLMDLTMPGRGGIAATSEIRAACPNTKIIVVSMHEDEVYARQALLAGASGYVLKSALAHELVRAIRSVIEGQQHFSSSLAAAAKDTPVEAVGRCQGHALELLTPREREVTSLLALGYTNLEVSRRLHISSKTVETHRDHIMQKLGLRTRADLVRFALEYGLMTT